MSDYCLKVKVSKSVTVGRKLKPFYSFHSLSIFKRNNLDGFLREQSSLWHLSNIRHNPCSNIRHNPCSNIRHNPCSNISHNVDSNISHNVDSNIRRNPHSNIRRNPDPFGIVFALKRNIGKRASRWSRLCVIGFSRKGDSSFADFLLPTLAIQFTSKY